MTHWWHVFPTLFQYFGFITLVGALIIRSFTIDFCSKTRQVFFPTIQRRLDTIFVFAMTALSLSLPVVLMVRATMMSGRSITEVMPIFPTLLFQSHYGSVWLIRCGLLMLLWFLFWPLKKIKKLWLVKLVFVCAVLYAWTLSATGHASGWSDFSWQQITDWLHIISASLWGGSMLATLFVIWPLLSCDLSQDFIKKITLRLSKLAKKVFLIVIATGLINCYLQLHSLANLIDTDYGQILLVKMILVLMMLYFAFINHNLYLAQLQRLYDQTGMLAKIANCLLFFVPGIKKQKNESAPRHFFQILILETICMLAVLFCTSVLRHGPPPPHMMM